MMIKALFFLSLLVIISGCTSTGGTDCVLDSNCVVYGESGDCNCGCYNKDNLPVGTGGACFCAAPTSCECVNGTCSGLFGD